MIHGRGLRIIFPLWLAAVVGIPQPSRAASPFTIESGLFDQADSVDLGLSRAPGTETIRVFGAAANTDKYVNGVALVGFKGMLYCQWQSSALHEDSTDTWVAYSRSADGATWSAPMKLALPGASDIKTSGGWWVHGDTLVAYVNVWPSGLSPRGGTTWYATSLDGLAWSSLKVLPMADGKPLAGVFEQDPHPLPDGRIVNAAHFQPGLLAAPIYTDDPSGIRGWKKAAYTNLSVSSNVSREIEPSWFRRADGALVMVFRDQTTTYRKLAAVSTDRGGSWSTATLTDMPDSRAKQSAGNLPDGTVFQVSNPVEGKRRSPLVLTLSKDGHVFDQAFLLRAGGSDLPVRRFEGKAKTLGYSYPKSAVWGDFLYVGYSSNKENIEITRVPLAAIRRNATAVSEHRSEAGWLRRVDGASLEILQVGRFAWRMCSPEGKILAVGLGHGSARLELGSAPGLFLVQVESPSGSWSAWAVHPR